MVRENLESLDERISHMRDMVMKSSVDDNVMMVLKEDMMKQEDDNVTKEFEGIMKNIHSNRMLEGIDLGKMKLPQSIDDIDSPKDLFLYTIVSLSMEYELAPKHWNENALNESYTEMISRSDLDDDEVDESAAFLQKINGNEFIRNIMQINYEKLTGHVKHQEITDNYNDEINMLLGM
jgi:hypothetical protein